MRFNTLTEELNSITKNYDYGIVPGSAAVFVKDEVLGIGRLDLTLLEGIMVVIEVSDQGYKIASSSPLSDEPSTLTALENVQACTERQSFETMDSLLMTASPLFRERFQSTLYDKLHKVQQQQLLDQQSLAYTNHDHKGIATSAPQISLDQVSIPVPKSSTSSATSSSSSAAAAATAAAATLLSHPYHYTNLPMTTNHQQQYPSPTSFDNPITSTSNQQDLMDEFNQWIH